MEGYGSLWKLEQPYGTPWMTLGTQKNHLYDHLLWRDRQTDRQTHTHTDRPLYWVALCATKNTLVAYFPNMYFNRGNTKYGSASYYCSCSPASLPVNIEYPRQLPALQTCPALLSPRCSPHTCEHTTNMQISFRNMTRPNLQGENIKAS